MGFSVHNFQVGGHGTVGASTEMGHEVNKGSRAPPLQRLRKLGAVQPGERKDLWKSSNI